MSAICLVADALTHGCLAQGALSSAASAYSPTAAPLSATGMHLGRLQITPSLRLTGGINSNPLFSDLNPESDFVFTVNPGIQLGTNRPRWNIGAGYNFNHIQYLETDVQDSDNHHADLNLLYRSYRWSAEASDKFDITNDAANSELLTQVGRTENRARFTLSYFAPSKDTEFRIGYSNHLTVFGEDLQGLNAFENLVMVTSLINVSSLIHFLPKTVFSFSAEYSMIDFPNTTVTQRTEGRGYNLIAGLNGKVTSKFSTLLEVAYNHLEFDVGPGTDNIAANLQFEYRWQRMNAKLGFLRGSQESFFTNYYDITSGLFELGWRSPNERWTLNNRVSYDVLDYSGPNVLFNGVNRSDELWRDQFKISFKLRKHTELFSEYTFIQRDSNAVDPITGSNSADFDQHIGLLGIFIYY